MVKQTTSNLNAKRKEPNKETPPRPSKKQKRSHVPEHASSSSATPASRMSTTTNAMAGPSTQTQSPTSERVFTRVPKPTVKKISAAEIARKKPRPRVYVEDPDTDSDSDELPRYVLPVPSKKQNTSTSPKKPEGSPIPKVKHLGAFELSSESEDDTHARPPRKRVKTSSKPSDPSHIIDLCSDDSEPTHRGAACDRSHSQKSACPVSGDVITITTDDEAGPSTVSHLKSPSLLASTSISAMPDALTTTSDGLEPEVPLPGPAPIKVPPTSAIPSCLPLTFVSPRKVANERHLDEPVASLAKLQESYQRALEEQVFSLSREIRRQKSPFTSVKYSLPTRVINYSDMPVLPLLNTPRYFSRSLLSATRSLTAKESVQTVPSVGLPLLTDYPRSIKASCDAQGVPMSQHPPVSSSAGGPSSKIVQGMSNIFTEDMSEPTQYSPSNSFTSEHITGNIPSHMSGHPPGGIASSITEDSGAQPSLLETELLLVGNHQVGVGIPPDRDSADASPALIQNTSLPVSVAKCLSSEGILLTKSLLAIAASGALSGLPQVNMNPGANNAISANIQADGSVPASPVEGPAASTTSSQDAAMQIISSPKPSAAAANDSQLSLEGQPPADSGSVSLIESQSPVGGNDSSSPELQEEAILELSPLLGMKDLRVDAAPPPDQALSSESSSDMEDNEIPSDLPDFYFFEDEPSGPGEESLASIGDSGLATNTDGPTAAQAEAQEVEELQSLPSPNNIQLSDPLDEDSAMEERAVNTDPSSLLPLDASDKTLTAQAATSQSPAPNITSLAVETGEADQNSALQPGLPPDPAPPSHPVLLSMAEIGTESDRTLEVTALSDMTESEVGAPPPAQVDFVGDSPGGSFLENEMPAGGSSMPQVLNAACQALTPTPEPSVEPFDLNAIPPPSTPQDASFAANSPVCSITSSNESLSPATPLLPDNTHPLILLRHPKPTAFGDEILRMNVAQLAALMGNCKRGDLEDDDDDDVSNLEFLYPTELY